MTLYEELGVGPNASTDEIRQAYRNLARLLHPDRQADEALRRLAEGQMRRLNEVCATLADPARRRQYDAATAALVPTPRAKTRTILAGREAAWFLAGLAVATLYTRLSQPRVQAPESDRVSVSAVKSQPVAKPRPKTAVVRPKAIRQPPRARIEPDRQPEPLPASEPVAIDPPAPAAPIAQPTILQVVPPEPLPVPVTAAAKRFDGTWLYVPPRAPDSGSQLYPAEYIEAVISEEAGEVRGRYRARYRVPDRPISAEVAFQFAGKTTGNDAAIAWSGAGGSEGEGKLVLLSPNTVRMDWLATSMGPQLGLASGTAVLTRRREP